MRVLGALVTAGLVVHPLYAAAQSGVQTQRFMATTISLDAGPASSALAAVWQDRLQAERNKLAALSKASPPTAKPTPDVAVPIFQATFKDGDKTIIISALFTTPECRNLSGVAAQNLNNCPMRVAVLRNGQVKVVKSESDFPFVAAFKETSDEEPSEYDNKTQRDKTMVAFNPAAHEITTALTLNGTLDSEKAAPIKIAY